MNKNKNNNLLSLEQIESMDIETVKKLYKNYINPGIEKIFSSFTVGNDIFESANGVFMYTKNKKKILDMTGGIGVLNHGHNNEKILNARIKHQKNKKMEVNKLVFSPYIAGLSSNLSNLLNSELNKVFFCNSGAEANEGAIKAAYRFHEGKKKYILHSDNAFHGKLIGTGSISGNYATKNNFPFFNYGKSFKLNDLNSINKIYKSGELENVFAIIIETYSASTLTSVDENFIIKLRDICTKLNIVLIFDEVYTGWGKTGYMFNYQRFKNINPDILTLSKSFGGGKSSISAYLTNEKIFKKTYEKEKDAFLHSTTYNGFSEECVTAIEAINIAVEENFPQKAKEIEKEINLNFVKLKNKFPNIIEELRGTGALHGIFFKKQFAIIQSIVKKINISFINNNKVFLSKIFVAAIIEKLYSQYNILAKLGEKSISSSEIGGELVYLSVDPSLIIKNEEIQYFFESLDKILSEGVYKINFDFISNVLKKRFLKN